MQSQALDAGQHPLWSLVGEAFWSAGCAIFLCQHYNPDDDTLARQFGELMAVLRSGRMQAFIARQLGWRAETGDVIEEIRLLSQDLEAIVGKSVDVALDNTDYPAVIWVAEQIAKFVTLDRLLNFLHDAEGEQIPGPAWKFARNLVRGMIDARYVYQAEKAIVVGYGTSKKAACRDAAFKYYVEMGLGSFESDTDQAAAK